MKKGKVYNVEAGVMRQYKKRKEEEREQEEETDEDVGEVEGGGASELK